METIADKQLIVFNILQQFPLADVGQSFDESVAKPLV